ncbi:hypothetical protein CJF32_00000412 [Rutstroemia sp. NJR-2017a WRK4]|nr:hypothetical protein CJF32_00000412 [Rutstroemia sp. NJR-2017a WRK4]
MSDYEDDEVDADDMDDMEGEAEAGPEEIEEEMEGEDYAEESSAPTYAIPSREVVSVEHPLIIQNLDNGIKTFGRAPNWSKILEGTEDECLPLYLRIRDPSCIPILSYNSITNNVLLKITVPKRTGRKRKRGSQDPYTDDSQARSTATTEQDSANNVQSHSRNDKPASILRKMRDNVDKYTVEAVGAIEQSHRYRGGKMREFRLGTDKGWKKNEEIVPPPTYTHHPLPFNWAYRQNPLITSEIDAETGETNVINRSKMPKLDTYYIHNDDGEVPTKPPHAVPGDPVLRDFVGALQQVMNERPIWTRRALANRLANETGLYLMKPALSYVGYQFRAGPWRDAVIRYGVDPRKDPTCRIYQTLFFKLYEDDERAGEGKWKDNRSQYTRNQTYGTGDVPSHMFNGTSLTLDGKVWQLCDITDPLLVPLIHDSPVAIEYDNNSDGYYNNGTMAKIRAIMKTKLIAIRSHKVIPENAFNIALSIPDFVPDKKGRKVHVPVPDMRLTDDEVAELRAKGVISGLSGKGVRRLDSRSKRKKYRRKRTGKGLTYGLMMGPKNSRQSDPAKTEKKDKDVKGKGKSTVVSGEGDISIREAMKTMDEWQDDEDEEDEDEDMEGEEERGEDGWGSENETTGSEDESEAEREKEMFRMNYEARNLQAEKK